MKPSLIIIIIELKSRFLFSCRYETYFSAHSCFLVRMENCTSNKIRCLHKWQRFHLKSRHFALSNFQKIFRVNEFRIEIKWKIGKFVQYPFVDQ